MDGVPKFGNFKFARRTVPFLSEIEMPTATQAFCSSLRSRKRWTVWFTNELFSIFEAAKTLTPTHTVQKVEKWQTNGKSRVIVWGPESQLWRLKLRNLNLATLARFNEVHRNSISVQRAVRFWQSQLLSGRFPFLFSKEILQTPKRVALFQKAYNVSFAPLNSLV